MVGLARVRDHTRTSFHLSPSRDNLPLTHQITLTGFTENEVAIQVTSPSTDSWSIRYSACTNSGEPFLTIYAAPLVIIETELTEFTGSVRHSKHYP